MTFFKAKGNVFCEAAGTTLSPGCFTTDTASFPGIVRCQASIIDRVDVPAAAEDKLLLRGENNNNKHAWTIK